MWRVVLLFGVGLGLAWVVLARPFAAGPAAPEAERPASAPPQAHTFVQPPAPAGAALVPPAPGPPPGGVGVYVHRGPDRRVVLQLREDGTFYLVSERSGHERREAPGRWRQEDWRIGLEYRRVGESALVEVDGAGEVAWNDLTPRGIRMSPGPGLSPLLLERQEALSLR